MQTIKNFIWATLIGFLTCSCFEQFSLGKEDDFEPKLVIEGTITNEDGVQEIVVSESSSPESAQFNPVSGCVVNIEDGEGNRFPFYESENAGHYQGTINGYYIIIGARYRLSVVTPTGKEYKSEFEELLPCPPVDSVYHELQSKPTTDPDLDEDGLQFYLDFNANDQYGNYYRWKLEETFEYHSTWPITKWLDVDGAHGGPAADYTYFTCYKTSPVKEIYVLSTEGLSGKHYKKFPLLFVNDHTQRLLHKYSLLVKQYSITKPSYYYWENLRKNNQEQGDLFGTQPANVKGNIYNVHDSAEVVLGFFGVSSVTSKRIMVSAVEGLNFYQVEYCSPIPIGITLPVMRPLYFVTAYDENHNEVPGYGHAQCFDCTLLGGTTEKPAYWDKK